MDEIAVVETKKDSVALIKRAESVAFASSAIKSRNARPVRAVAGASLISEVQF